MKKKNSFWKSTSLEPIAVIILTILATSYGIFHTSIDLLLAAIALTLALIASGIGRDRKSREALTNQIAEIKASLPSQLSAMAFFHKDFPAEVKQEIEKANEVWLVGFRLSRTLPTYITILDKKLARGEKVKVILLDPESQAVHYCNETMSYPMKLEQFRESIRTSINLLKDLEAYKTGNLEIRLIDQPLPFGGYGVNINDTEGKLYIKQYEYQAKTDGIRFILTSKDGTWYEIYRQQLMSLWKNAKPIRRNAGRRGASR